MQLTNLCGISMTVSLVGAYLMYSLPILTVTVVKFDHMLIMGGNFPFIVFAVTMGSIYCY